LSYEKDNCSNSAEFDHIIEEIDISNDGKIDF